MEVRFVPQQVIIHGLHPSNEDEMLKRIELAGRTAYLSENKITKDSATKFVELLISRKHLSVTEHSNITIRVPDWLLQHPYELFKERVAFHKIKQYFNYVYISGNVRSWLESVKLNYDNYSMNLINIVLYDKYPSLFTPAYNYNETNRKITKDIDVINENDQLDLLRHNHSSDLPIFMFEVITDRGITHEIVRHRINMSYTQVSLRYVDCNKKGFVMMDIFDDYPPENKPSMIETIEKCIEEYEFERKSGIKPQIARDFLPHLTQTRIMISGRYSAFEHFIQLRNSKDAHPRIQKIAQDMQNYFNSIGVY